MRTETRADDEKAIEFWTGSKCWPRSIKLQDESGRSGFFMSRFVSRRFRPRPASKLRPTRLHISSLWSIVLRALISSRQIYTPDNGPTPKHTVSNSARSNTLWAGCDSEAIFVIVLSSQWPVWHEQWSFSQRDVWEWPPIKHHYPCASINVGPFSWHITSCCELFKTECTMRPAYLELSSKSIRLSGFAIEFSQSWGVRQIKGHVLGCVRMQRKKG